MKSALVAVIAVAALTTGSAMAAPPMPDPPFNWTGCYVGIHAGGGVHSSDFIDDEGMIGGIGAVAGGQAGCNYQISRLVIGLEGELFWSSLNDKQSSSFPGDFEFFSESANNKYDATVALRLGYTIDRLLAYGKVGGAWGGFSWFETDTCCGPGAGSILDNASQSLFGILFGIGFEYAFTNQLSAKLEYDYMNFGNQSVNFTETCTLGACIGGPFAETLNETKQILKVGLNYKLY